MTFLPFENSNNEAPSASMNFPINSEGDTSFHHKTFDYSCAAWDGFSDQTRDVP